MRYKTTRNPATVLVILINVLPKDGPLGPKHFVNPPFNERCNLP